MSTQISQTNLDDFDLNDFLSPDSSAIITTPENVEAPKATVFSSTPDADLSFLDEKETPADADTPAAGDESIEDILGNPGEEPEPKETPKRRTEKSTVEVFNKLIEDGLLIPFDDDKPLDEYSAKDFQELLEVNFQEREKKIKETTPQEFFDALPEQLQYAAKYVADGGQDLKGLFRALAETQAVTELDATNPEHHEAIVRNYLFATKFGSAEDIEEQIADYAANGTLGKWAAKHKPKLDDLGKEQVEAKLRQQEEFKIKQQQQRDEFLKNVHDALKPAELNGIKLERKQQEGLWKDLTQTNYQSLSGRPTNKLGHLLEQYQFGETKRYDLIAEALWLLDDPEGYKAKIKQQASSETSLQTARALKTEAGRKIASTTPEEPEKEPARRTLSRPGKANIFAR